MDISKLILKWTKCGQDQGLSRLKISPRAIKLSNTDCIYVPGTVPGAEVTVTSDISPQQSGHPGECSQGESRDSEGAALASWQEVRCSVEPIVGCSGRCHAYDYGPTNYFS